MNQLNPSITSPRMGDRSRASRVSPRNTTGRLYAEQHAAQDAKRAAATLDIEAIRRTAHASGHAAGYEAGFLAGWQALADHLVEEGILDPDEPGDDHEDQGDEHEPANG